MFNLADKSILVTDDSAIMRMFLVMNLKRMLKVNITEAVNGLDALAKLKSGKFDLLLTDMNMPEMNGAELVRYVRTGAEQRHADRDHHDQGRDKGPGMPGCRSERTAILPNRSIRQSSSRRSCKYLGGYTGCKAALRHDRVEKQELKSSGFSLHLLTIYSLTGTPRSFKYSFACLIVYSLKWKIEAASAASALPAVNP